jgi:hypothetical protein
MAPLKVIAKSEHKRMVIRLAFAGVAGVAAWFLLLFMTGRLRSTERVLDAVATRHYRVEDSHPNREIRRYAWLTDRDLLEVTSRPGGGVLRLARFDTERRASYALPNLEKTVLKAGYGAGPMVSPDGKWIVCWVVALRPRRTEWLVAVSADGSRIIRWPTLKHGVVHYLGYGWMPDGKTFLLIFVNKILVYRVQAPGKMQRLWIPKMSPEQSFIGMLPEGPLLAGWRQSGPSYTFTHVQMTNSPPTVRSFKVDLPPAATVGDVQVSPQGDRLAWHLKFDDSPPTSTILRGLHSLLQRRPHSREGLWVSHVDGSDMHELGHVHDNDLTLRQWVPGGNHLAFLRKDYQYSVPVR